MVRSCRRQTALHVRAVDARRQAEPRKKTESWRSERGEEMGGFQLGSTIVLVFEAPKGVRPSLDEGYEGKRNGGFEWNIEQGQKVKVGEALGVVREVK